VTQGVRVTGAMRPMLRAARNWPLRSLNDGTLSEWLPGQVPRYPAMAPRSRFISAARPAAWRS
jgi:hypothetical protein